MSGSGSKAKTRNDMPKLTRQFCYSTRTKSQLFEIPALHFNSKT